MVRPPPGAWVISTRRGLGRGANGTFWIKPGRCRREGPERWSGELLAYRGLGILGHDVKR